MAAEEDNFPSSLLFLKGVTMLEQLKSRLKELTAQKQQAQVILNQALADIQTINGAILENQHWIAKLEQEAKTDEG
jgi:peptidoglycan hydrolase CwlO-like protein